MKIQSGPVGRVSLKLQAPNAPETPVPGPTDLVEIKIHRGVTAWAATKATGLGLASGFACQHLVSSSPWLAPLALAGSWLLSKPVERPQGYLDRTLFMAGSMASLAAAMVAPQWASAVILGQAAVQGLWAGLSTRPMRVPHIESSDLRHLLQSQCPEFESLCLPEQLKVVHSIYAEQVTPEHLAATDASGDMLFQDQAARQKLEGWLGQPYPGKVYTYHQERMEESPGVAVGPDLAFSHELLKQSDSVTQWFVVGHERSHVQNSDFLLPLAADSLLDLSDGLTDPRDLPSAMTPEQHRIELRADRDGADFAISKGATALEILESVHKLLGDSPSCPSHPSSNQRVRALGQHLQLSDGSAKSGSRQEISNH